METNEVLEKCKEFLEKYIESSNYPEDNRLDIWVNPENITYVIEALIDQRWGYLMTITGVDVPPVVDQENVEIQPGCLEALYHFANEADVLTIRVKVPYSNPQIESICSLIPSATIYEREAIELFGFDLVNTPSTDRLVLPDSWPEGVYPMRKSFTSLQPEEIKKKEPSNE